MYTVDQLIKYADTKPIIDVNISELTWMYPHDRISKKRLAGIVIDGFPIIVTRRTDGTLVTLDGFHRTYKAWKEGRKTIKARFITPADIEKLNKAATVSTEEKDPKEIGEDIERIRKFGEDKNLPEDAINSMIQSEFKEEKSSVEEWLTQTVAGNGEQTSLQQVVSQEGFMEAAGDILRNMIKGKKPDFNNIGSETTHDNIKRTYANLTWVKSRRLISGEVSVPTGSILTGDFKGDISKLLATAKSTCQANMAVVNKLLQDANPHIQLLTTEAWKDPKKVQVVDEKAKPLPEGAKFKDISFKDLQANPAKLKALTAEQVVEVAQLVLSIREVYYGGVNPFKGSKWDNIFNVKVGGVGGMSRYEQAFSEKDPRYKKMEEHYSDDEDTWVTLANICEAFCTMGYGCEYDWSTNSEHGGWEMSLYLKALVGWIDGSVK